MADICGNDLVFEGPVDELKNLNALFKKWLDARWETENHYAWLGYIVKGAGFKTLDDGGFECQGCVTYLEDYDGTDTYFSMDTETDWGPMNDMWYAILEKFAPHCKLYWYSYAPGGEVCASNDVHHKHFMGDYAVETNLPSDNLLCDAFFEGEPVNGKKLQYILEPLYGMYPMEELLKKVKEKNTDTEWVIITPISYKEDYHG